MIINQPEFQSLRNIRDNAILLSIANEYLSEDVYLSKLGTELSKNISALKLDVIGLKKQFPGKFTSEVNTDKIFKSFDETAHSMVSGSDEVKTDCNSGKLGTSLGGDINRITDAIEKIWQQVKGTDVKYTKTESIGTFFGRLNILSKIGAFFSGIFKILLILLIISLAVFSYLFFTMEKKGPLLKENKELMAFIEEKRAVLKGLENNKAAAQKDLKRHETGKLQREDKIAIIEIETQIQELNQEIHAVEGQIEIRENNVNKNNEKLEVMNSKSFIDRLLKK